MKKNLNRATSLLFSSIFSSGFFFLSSLALAGGATHEKTSPATPTLCGVLDSFAGDVEVLDSTRERLVSLSLRTPLACGNWIATNPGGWAQIKHESGAIVLLGPDTLVQILPLTADSSKLPDHFTLYKGELYLEVGGGQGELRIISPTGRVRTDRGRAIMTYFQAEDKTQLVALENSARLANRFEAERSVLVQAGEMTELDFKLLRVMPLLPKPVSMPSLRSILAELRISEREQTLAEAAAKRASDRRIAGLPIEGDHLKRSPETYMRHIPAEDDVLLKSRWMRKIAGGTDESEKILYPEKYAVPTQKVQVEVRDVEAKFKKRSEHSDEREKRRIMEELSRIKADK